MKVTLLILLISTLSFGAYERGKIDMHGGNDGGIYKRELVDKRYTNKKVTQKKQSEKKSLNKEELEKKELKRKKDARNLGILYYLDDEMLQDAKQEEQRSEKK